MKIEESFSVNPRIRFFVLIIKLNCKLFKNRKISFSIKANQSVSDDVVFRFCHSFTF